MPCIFCPTYKRHLAKKLTAEHVFPAFIGGKLKLASGSCDRCNREFGKAESAVKNATRELLNLLKIRNRDGVVPSVPVKALIKGVDMTDLPAFVDGTHDIRIESTVRDSATAQGRKMRSGLFKNARDAEVFISRETAKGGELIERPMPDQIVVQSNYVLRTRFAFTVPMRKMVAKIAFAAVAYRYGTEYACERAFDQIRRAATATGDRDLAVWIFANNGFMSAYTKHASQHSVMCFFSAEWKRAWAVVTLFGGLTYRVNLTDRYDGRDQQFSIFYDAISRKKMERVVVLADEKTIIGHVISSATTFENRDAVEAQWFPLVHSFCAEKGIEMERFVGENPPPAPWKEG